MDIVKRKFLFSCLLTGCMSCATHHHHPSLLRKKRIEKATHTAQAFLYIKWYCLIPHPHKQNLLWHYGESVICLVILFMCICGVIKFMAFVYIRILFSNTRREENIERKYEHRVK